MGDPTHPHVVRHLMVGDLAFRAYSSAHDLRPGRAPVYILVHGLGTSHRYLSRLHDEFAKDGAVVHSIDMPGFGGVPRPARSPDVVEMANALGQILGRLGAADVILVGHSMGAQWVVELALQHPDLVRGVVVIGPVADDQHRSLRAQGAALAVDTLGEPPDINVIVTVEYLRSGTSWFVKQGRHMVSYPIEDRIQHVHAPVLVLRGGNDPIAGTDWCRRLRDAAPCGMLATIPGHRHVVQHSAPKSVASAIRSLVTRRTTFTGAVRFGPSPD